MDSDTHLEIAEEHAKRAIGLMDQTFDERDGAEALVFATLAQAQATMAIAASTRDLNRAVRTIANTGLRML